MFPQAIYGGGRLIQNVEVTPIYVGSTNGSPGAGDWATDPMLRQMICRINRFLDDILASAYWDQLALYGSPDGKYKIGRGKRMPHVIAPFDFSKQAFNVQQFLKASFDSGLLPAANANSVYVLYYPPAIQAPDQLDEPAFTNNQGQDVVYAIVGYTNVGNLPPTANAFDYMTFWSSHVLTEMVTDPDGPTTSGWEVDWVGGRPYFPIASGFCEPVTALFQGFLVSKIFNQQTHGCYAPPDDGLAKPAPQIGIKIKSSTADTADTCRPPIVEGATVEFSADLTNYGSTVQSYKWNLMGPMLAGSGTGSTFSVQVPAGGTQFTVYLQVTDTQGCISTATRVFVSVPFQQAEMAEVLCKIRHELNVNWRFNTVWDPLRDYTTISFDQADLARLEGNLQQLSQIIGQLRDQLTRSGR